MKTNIMNFVEIFFAFLTWIFHVLYGGVLLFYNGNYNEGLNATLVKPISHKTIIRKIVKINFDSLNETITQEYIRRSEPLIIANIPATHFQSLTETYNNSNLKNAILKSKNALIINTHILPQKLGHLKHLIKNFLNNKLILILVRFSGSYDDVLAHLDVGASYNFYYLHKGKKFVQIIPHEYTHYLNLNYGSDNVHVVDDLNDKKMTWLNKLPEYYSFYLNEGEVLLFNNCKTIHKFKNVNGNEDAYSIRFLHDDSSGLSLKRYMYSFPLTAGKTLANSNTKRDYLDNYVN